jgi:hypothetical protein
MGGRAFFTGALCGFCVAAVAQPAPPSAVPLAAPAPYQDKVIDGASAAQDAQDVDDNPYDSSGLPRGYTLELLTDQHFGSVRPNGAVGIKASGFLDTLNYGSLSGNFTLQNQNNGVVANGATAQQKTFVLRQLGMPFDAGWRADNAIGMVNLTGLDLARASPRVTAPSPAMFGLASNWRHEGGLGLMAAVGQPGRFDGYPGSSFSTESGAYALLAANDQSRQGNTTWIWGAMLAQAQNVSSVLSVTPQGQGLMDAQGVYLAARREVKPANPQEAPGYVQINALRGQNTGTSLTGAGNAPASGIWADGSFSAQANQNNWGLFRLEPGLSWLDVPLASDLQGAYWRYTRRSRQWQGEAGIELLNSVSGLTGSGFFANGNLRYQYSNRTSYGITASLRHYGLQAQSVQVYSQFNNDWGYSRLQFELASADTGDRQVQVKIDHDWSFLQDVRLSSSVGYDRDMRPTGDSQGYSAAVNAEWSLGQNLSITNSAQGRWSTAVTQYTFNTGLYWQLSPHWSLSGTFYAIQGRNSAITLAQSPLTVPSAATADTQDSGAYILLRYQDNAGRKVAPLGGPPGAAAGALSGTVYLDDNNNGKRDAGERGAPNVTVLLDGKFGTQTDNQGKFEFPYLAAGTHVITVNSDNLPLPYGLVKEGRTEVKVFTRNSTTADIAAVRQ